MLDSDGGAGALSQVITAVPAEEQQLLREAVKRTSAYGGGNGSYTVPAVCSGAPTR
jgi:hypothetical protein